jgi:hypothetical protein
MPEKINRIRDYLNIAGIFLILSPLYPCGVVIFITLDILDFIWIPYPTIVRQLEWRLGMVFMLNFHIYIGMKRANLDVSFITLLLLLAVGAFLLYLSTKPRPPKKRKFKKAKTKRFQFLGNPAFT